MHTQAYTPELNLYFQMLHWDKMTISASILNQLKWSLNVDCKSKCVYFGCSLTPSLWDGFFNTAIDTKWEEVMNILIAADNTANTMIPIQCAVCLCSRVCASICVCLLFSLCWGLKGVTLLLVWLAQPTTPFRGGRGQGCQVVGNGPLTHTVYRYWGLALRFSLSQSLWQSLIMSC